MIFLGIDPGTTTTGFAFIEKENQKIRIIEYGVISTPPGQILSEKLCILYADIGELLDIYQPDIVGIERLFFLKNVTNGIDVAQARGVLIHTFASRGIPIQEFTPLQVKQAITGNGRATKTQMQKAIAMILKMAAVPKPDDAADALAIAYITAISTRNFPTK